VRDRLQLPAKLTRRRKKGWGDTFNPSGETPTRFVGLRNAGHERMVSVPEELFW